MFFNSILYILQLKNPTRYHVIQSQKEKVRELLTSSSSFWQSRDQLSPTTTSISSSSKETTTVVSNPDVCHKHLLCPPKPAGGFMPRSAPEEIQTSIEDQEESMSLMQHCSSSAPEPNQVSQPSPRAPPQELLAKKANSTLKKASGHDNGQEVHSRSGNCGDTPKGINFDGSSGRDARVAHGAVGNAGSTKGNASASSALKVSLFHRS